MSEERTAYGYIAPSIRFEERSLPHQLTFEERERKGLELAHATAEADRIEAEGKRVAKNYKAQLDTAESMVRAQAGILNQGYEYRETRCRCILSLSDDTRTTVREDTGEVVETRRLNSTERRELEASRQPALPGFEAVVAPAESAEIPEGNVVTVSEVIPEAGVEIRVHVPGDPKLEADLVTGPAEDLAYAAGLELLEEDALAAADEAAASIPLPEYLGGDDSDIPRRAVTVPGRNGGLHE